MFQQWTVEDNATFVPSHETVLTANNKLSLCPLDDFVVTFYFSERPASNVRIHASRLSLAGGPMSALIGEPFKEGRTRIVELPAEEEPFVFQVFKDFLYFCPIDAVRFHASAQCKFRILNPCMRCPQDAPSANFFSFTCPILPGKDQLFRVCPTFCSC